MTILVTGGAGYIGSHTVVKLLESNFDVVVLDNLSNSNERTIDLIQKITKRPLNFYQGDIQNKQLLNKVFEEFRIETVIHFAGYKSISESIENPNDYYSNNIQSTLSLIETMKRFNCKNLVFSSSAVVYGSNHKPPFSEEMEISSNLSPYGKSKFFQEEILKDISATKEIKCIALRYFNPVGAHNSGLIGEFTSKIPDNLCPYIMEVALGKREELKIFGKDYPTIDGTCLRDFIHIDDLAVSHIKAVEYLNKQSTNNTSSLFEIINVGTGKPTSVIEMLNAFEKANGEKIPHKFVERRKGDEVVSYADVSKMKRILGFEAKLTIHDMAKDSLNFAKNTK